MHTHISGGFGFVGIYLLENEKNLLILCLRLSIVPGWRLIACGYLCADPFVFASAPSDCPPDDSCSSVGGSTFSWNASTIFPAIYRKRKSREKNGKTKRNSLLTWRIVVRNDEYFARLGRRFADPKVFRLHPHHLREMSGVNVRMQQTNVFEVVIASHRAVPIRCNFLTCAVRRMSFRKIHKPFNNSAKAGQGMPWMCKRNSCLSVNEIAIKLGPKCASFACT